MAGSIDLSTQGITSPFRVETQTPSPRPRPAVEKSESKAANEKESSGVDKKALQGVADSLNTAASIVDRDLKFSVDEETGRVVIKVTNSSTGEVIRVIPPEEISAAGDSAGSLVGLLYSAET